MTQTQQPEALQLAHTLIGGKLIDDSTEWADTLHAAATELRRQHARIEELEEQLSAIGAGEVNAAHPAEGVPALEVTACYFPKSGEAYLTWERLGEDGKRFGMTVKVTPEQGEALANVVYPCVPWLATTPATVDMGIPMSESAAPKMRPEAWLATFRPKGMLSSHSVAGTNLEELKRSVPSDSKFKPLYAQPILTIVGMSTTAQTKQGGTQQ